MTTIYQNIQSWVAGTADSRFKPNQFVRENITRSWWLTAWLAVLAGFSLWVVIGQLQAAPITTIIVLVAWVTTVSMVVVGELRHKHTAASLWMKNGLYSSITNSLVTLVLVLLIIAAVRAFVGYAVINASFAADPRVVAESSFTGANWGAVLANMRNLLVFQFPSGSEWRIYLELAILGLMAGASTMVYRESFKGPKIIRRILTGLWLVTPIVSYILLRGVNRIGVNISTDLSPARLIVAFVFLAAVAGVTIRLAVAREDDAQTFFSPGRIIWLGLAIVSGLLISGVVRLQLLNAPGFESLRIVWGGLLFTLVMSVFAIVVSFPMGVMLALGRRSKIRGVPAWFSLGVTLLLTAWFLFTSTPNLLETSRNSTERLVAFWPLLILLAGYLFQRYFQGNVVAAASTIYIECVRGVPLITVLFMALTLFPIFLPTGIEFLQTWRALWGFTFFAAAYLAENVRGGLQAIPKGQYEAADSLGLSTFDKYRLIILPQAIRIVIPAIVGQFIGLFKDTTLVIIVGLNDFLGVANLISAQQDWLGVRTEPYIFLMVVYFIGSAAMAGYSRRLEARLGVGQR